MEKMTIPPLPYATWSLEHGKHLGKVEDKLDEMVRAYLICAVWADKPEDEDWYGLEFSDHAKSVALFDCCMFLHLARHHIGGWTMEQLGHDLWLTRNGHGAGFWDRDLGTVESRNKLTDIAELIGPRDVYRDADLQLEFA